MFKYNLINCVVFILTFCALCFTPYTSVEAQQITDKFLVHEDLMGGFKVSYPSSWELKPTTMSIGNGVNIKAPRETFNDVYDTNAFVSFAGMSLPSASRSLEDVNTFKLGLKIPGVTESILESGSTTIAGLPAYRVVKEQSSILDIGMGASQKVLEMWTVHGDKWYDVLYIAPTDKYDNYLPTVLQMVDTFEIQ